MTEGDDKHLGAWVYCAQHVRPHETGWCTVDLKDKTALAAATRDEAYAEAERLGLFVLAKREDSVGNGRSRFWSHRPIAEVCLARLGLLVADEGPQNVSVHCRNCGGAAYVTAADRDIAPCPACGTPNRISKEAPSSQTGSSGGAQYQAGQTPTLEGCAFALNDVEMRQLLVWLAARPQPTRIVFNRFRFRRLSGNISHTTEVVDDFDGAKILISDPDSW